VEFVYPKQKAADLAQANQQTVPSTSEEVLDSAVMKTAAIEEAEPAPPAPVASADNNDQPESDAVVATATELPQTASSISLIAIVGFFLLGAAFVLRRVSALPR
jgi:LPXTG-motif cell wall-anchored protein